MTMNSPIEVKAPDLDGMLNQGGALNLFNKTNIVSPFRYQEFEGPNEDKNTAITWLEKNYLNQSR